MQKIYPRKKRMVYMKYKIVSVIFFAFLIAAIGFIQFAGEEQLVDTNVESYE